MNLKKPTKICSRQIAKGGASQSSSLKNMEGESPDDFKYFLEEIFPPFLRYSVRVQIQKFDVNFFLII